jgi:hypothetical protein
MFMVSYNLDVLRNQNAGNNDQWGTILEQARRRTKCVVYRIAATEIPQVINNPLCMQRGPINRNRALWAPGTSDEERNEGQKMEQSCMIQLTSTAKSDEEGFMNPRSISHH